MKKAKTTSTWRGWGVMQPSNGLASCPCGRSPFLETLCEEVAIDKARENGWPLVKVVAKITEVKP
jgi:hypothetical protein